MKKSTKKQAVCGIKFDGGIDNYVFDTLGSLGLAPKPRTVVRYVCKSYNHLSPAARKFIGIELSNFLFTGVKREIWEIKKFQELVQEEAGGLEEYIECKLSNCDTLPPEQAVQSVCDAIVEDSVDSLLRSDMAKHVITSQVMNVVMGRGSDAASEFRRHLLRMKMNGGILKCMKDYVNHIGYASVKLLPDNKKLTAKEAAAVACAKAIYFNNAASSAGYPVTYQKGQVFAVKEEKDFNSIPDTFDI